MSTQSIFRNVVIDTKAGVQSFVGALNRAEGFQDTKSTKENRIVKAKTLEPEQISTFFRVDKSAK